MQSLKALAAPLFLVTDRIDEDPVTALLLSKLPVAAMLLDADGQVVQLNMAGKALLDGGDGLIHRPGRRLRASLSYEDRQLRQMLEPLLAAAGRGDGMAQACPVLRLHRPSGRTPFLLVVDGIQAWRPSFGAKAVLLVRIIDSDPEPEPEGRSYALQDAFELTAAETRIAELIATGRSPRSAAQHLALSTNTVRTHLARIFDKTGVHSQHALVRLLMALGSRPTP